MDRQTNAFSNLLLDENFQCLNRILKKKTIFDILRIENKEVPFTRLLTWLLDPHADHQMGSFPLRAFLRHCLRSGQVGEKVISAVQLEKLNFADVSVNSEYEFSVEVEGGGEELGKKQGRLDVYAEYSGDEGQGRQYPLLLIEAKIGASQHNAQTHRYQKWVERQGGENPPFKPVLIYLTPEGEVDETIASDFIPMDFTQINSWLDTLKSELKSSQAQFLIEELYTLNARTSRAWNGELDELVEKISQKNEASLQLLRGGLQLRGSVVDEYEPALVHMNLIASRRGSLGFDDHIAIIRGAAQELLGEDEKWKISGGEGSLTIRYLPLQESLNRDFQTSNAINLDFWLDRSKNHLEIAVYSNKNKIPATIDEVQLRRELVKVLRRLCSDQGLSTLEPQSGKNFQVARIDLPRGATSAQFAKKQLSDLCPFASLIDRWLEAGFEEWRTNNIG